VGDPEEVRRDAFGGRLWKFNHLPHGPVTMRRIKPDAAASVVMRS
jgi:hypothetical protein